MSASPYLGLGVAVACASAGSILVRAAAAPALAVSFHRVFLATLLISPFVARPALASWSRLTPRSRGVLLISGTSLALHFATWIASLSYTSVAASVVLVNTTPLFTLVFGRALLAERARPRALGAIALALAGVALIAGGDWSEAGRRPLLGDALALAGAATLSLHHVIGRGLRAALPLAAYVFWVWAASAGVLAVLCAGWGVALTGYTARTFAFLLALALVPTILGHGLVNRSLRLLPAHTVGLFLLGEPVGASLLAYWLLGEAPGPWTLAGGAVILAALGLAISRGGA